MYGEEEGGTGTIHGKWRGKRGRSQSEESDDEGEDGITDGRKRVCTEGEGRGKWEDTDSEEDEGLCGSWLRTEMEGIEERGGKGQEMWEGENRKRREREWEMEGWEYWQMTMEGGGEEDVAVNTEEGMGARSMMGDGGGGGVNESEGNDGGNIREMEGKRDVEGKGMDGRGRGGRRKGDNLTRREQISRREPLRGGRRKKGSIPEGEKEMMAHYMKRWLGSAPCKPR